MVNLQQRARGVKVLKAVSSPLRLQILNLLFDKGGLSYTELMNALKMNPSRDAGRFAYHLKFLLKADLIEPDSEARKYSLTDLGKMVLDVADRVEKKADKPRGLTIRTSHYTLEEFDVNKIANSLIKEAKMPPELAQKAAKEAEKRLIKSKTKYLTAPLVREVVNGILVEKGLEDYRHKLTRLGMPVHEVTVLMEAKSTTERAMDKIALAGETIFGEYTLLNIFPRDIADAHVSGSIHIDCLGTWVLKLDEIFHDLRFFLQNGIAANRLQISIEHPKNFESALSITFNVLLHGSKELNSTQTCDYFNVFLAPFARGLDSKRIKECLRLFTINLSQHAKAALGIELAIPKFIADKAAVGPEGKTCGTYSDYFSESLLIALLLSDVLLEESNSKPLLNPKIVVKLSNEALESEKAKAVLLKVHDLATKSGTPLFVNAVQRESSYPVFSSSGCKLETDLTGDWETDTLRTGCLGSVTINLPRIVIESEKDKNKFFEILRERYEMAARALGIKYGVLRPHAKTFFPFLMQNLNDDTYLRLENCSRLINLAGFRETVEAFSKKEANSEEGSKFAEEIIQVVAALKQKLGRKHGKRLYPAILFNNEASERLARLDIEKYGVARIKFSGTRDKPFYSTANRLRLQPGDFPIISSAALDDTRKLKGASTGGSLNIVDLGETEYNPEALLALTSHLVQNQELEFFTYNRVVTYCSNCRKSWFGLLHKCPSCGAVSTLTVFDSFSKS